MRSCKFAPDITPQQYESDVLLRSLVERQCEIIGEALRRLERKDPYTFAKIHHARRIIDFRNIIAHGYDSLDSTVVSQVVRLHLRNLLDDVAASTSSTKSYQDLVPANDSVLNNTDNTETADTEKAGLPLAR